MENVVKVIDTANSQQLKVAAALEERKQIPRINVTTTHTLFGTSPASRNIIIHPFLDPPPWTSDKLQ
jgi:hypothetical protein